jgi:hypothetical protein
MDPIEESLVVPLRVTQRVTLDPDRAYDCFADSNLAWLGAPADAPSPAGHRRLRADLRLPLSAAGREVTFHKAALLDLGRPVRQDGRLDIDISWRSTNLAPLFPIFTGKLTIGPDSLTLDGLYAPPGGRLGVALDKALLGIAARRTARWFLGLVIEGLANEPGDR